MSSLFTIKSSGRVGINSTSPSSALDVKGDMTIYNANNQGDIFFGEHGDVSDHKALIRMDQLSSTAGELQFHTEGGGTLTKRLTITSTGVVHQSNGSAEMTWSRQTGRAQQGNAAAVTYTIKTFYYGIATFKIALSDGNYKWAHFVVEIGGMQYSSGNGYNATVVANSTGNGPSISTNKQDGGYHITITNGGNSNTLFGSWVLEGTSYTDGSKPTLVTS